MTISLAARPSDCLYALASASIGMQSAQNEAFDKLYAAEFKRFIAGKIVSASPTAAILLLTEGFDLRPHTRGSAWSISQIGTTAEILEKSCVSHLSRTRFFRASVAESQQRSCRSPSARSTCKYTCLKQKTSLIQVSLSWYQTGFAASQSTLGKHSSGGIAGSYRDPRQTLKLYIYCAVGRSSIAFMSTLTLAS